MRLEEIVDTLHMRGPLTAKELKHLGVGRFNSLNDSGRICKVFISADSIGSSTHPIRELIPDLTRQTIYFLPGQTFELGLRIGRVAPGGNKEVRSSFTRILRHALHAWPEALGVANLHYIPKSCISEPHNLYSKRTKLFAGLQDAGYILRASHRNFWTNRGLCALARVHENQRQGKNTHNFNGFKVMFARADWQPSFVELAGKLGWSNGYIQNYAVLAREAGQPLRVYVIGAGWQRLFDFGVQELPRERRSNSVASFAHQLLRGDINYGVDAVLDRLCSIALATKERGRLSYSSTPAVIAPDERFLRRAGLITTRLRGNGIILRATSAGEGLYKQLQVAGRLDEAGHYAHI